MGMRHHIRAFIYRRLVTAILACGLAAGLGVAACGAWLFQGAITGAERAAYRDAENRFALFDLLVSAIESDIRVNGRRALESLALRFPSPGAAIAAGREGLQRAAAELGIGEIYFIGRDGKVAATSFPPDDGLDLFGISGELRLFLEGLYGTGRFADQRISLSTRTGEVNGYQYHSPAGADFIIEISTRFESVAPRVYPGQCYSGIVNLVFGADGDGGGLVRFVDCVLANPASIYSYFQTGPVDPAIQELTLRTLESGTDQELADGDRLLRTRRLSFPPRGFDHVDSPPVCVFEFDRGPLRKFLLVSVLIALLSGAGTAGVAIAALHRTLSRRFTGRVELLERGMSEIAAGRDPGSLDDGADDEISSMARSAASMVSEIHARAEESVRNARIDAVTGLPNRQAFLEESATVIGLLERLGGERTMALVYLDLDHFKLVNDGYGHSAGDGLLREIGSRIRAQLRDSDRVYRIGGDEFVITLASLRREEDVADVLGKLKPAISGLVRVQGREIRTTASFGIALYPRDGRDAGELLRLADAALYEAKRERDRWVFFTAELGERVTRRTELAEALKAGPGFSGFRLVLQPIVTASGELSSFEALARWRKPDGTEVPPAEFIPILEDFGLIIEFGSWCLGAAAAMSDALSEAGIRAKLAVNLSMVQLADCGHIGEISARTASGELDPGRIYFEVTESCTAEERKAGPALRTLSGLGYRISLDDFGSGYSSLGRLGSLPFNTLKVDRLLLDAGGKGMANDDVLRGIMSLGSGYGVDIVVEGVETREMAVRLGGLGFGLFQGFYFSRPLELDRAIAYAREHGG